VPRLQASRGARPVAVDPDAPERAPSPHLGRLYLSLLLTAAVVVALDQGTKQLALSHLGDGPIDLIEGILRFRLTYNSGGAFGLLQGLPGFFLVATLVIVGGILIGLRRLEDPRWAIPLGLVLGGGIGNAVDRVVRDTGGGVVDFIDLHVWPVFNIADMSIVVGVFSILILGWRTGDGSDPSG